MTEFVEAIGWIVIICVILYYILSHYASSERKSSELEELIFNSDKCQEIIRRETKRVWDINTKIYQNVSYPNVNENIKKEIFRVINEPVERQKALDNIKRKQIEKERKEREAIEDKRNKRKIGYKYEKEIFEIFGNKQELSPSDLIELTEIKFNISEESALEIIKIWKDNDLIQNWFRDNYTIGPTLTIYSDVIDSSDMSWKKWLSHNNINIEP